MVSVFVSGATGFIASTTVKELISRGYTVVGSVRSPSKGEKLKKHFPSGFSYEVVPDLSASGAFDEAVKKHPEVTVFLHTASPFFFDTTDVEKDLLLPAINGTKNALSAIKKYGPQISRVVYTSSYASVASVLECSNPALTVSEKSWNPITYDQALGKGIPAEYVGIMAYYGSKTFGEKAAWDFVKNEKPNFALTVINPTVVLGPQAFDEDAKGDLNASAEVVKSLLNARTEAEIAPYDNGFVDVRDIARAHIAGFENEEAKGKRLLVNTGMFSAQGILNFLHEKFPQATKNTTRGTPGDDAKRLANLAKIDNRETNSILAYTPIGFEQSVSDAVEQILRVRD